MPDDLQPQEGQGDAGTGGIFDPYLSAVPEEARDAVAGYLKDAEKNVNGRLAEAADLQKNLGPYKDVDLSGYDPETLQQLIAWHQQTTADPDAYKQFIEGEAKELGITPQEAEEVIAAEEDGQITREQIQEMVRQGAEDRLEPIQQELTTLQEEKAVDAETQAIDQAFAQITSETKLDLTKDLRAQIMDLGMPLAFDAKGNELPMGDASWVRKGFDRLKEIQDLGNRTFVEEKAQMPGGALTKGGTAAMKPITSYSDANDALRERLRQAT
jgi:DNA-binding transcriptional MerR regulator